MTEAKNQADNEIRCLQQARATIDRVLINLPNKIKFDVNVNQESDAITMLAANLGLQTFNACMARAAAPKGR